MKIYLDKQGRKYNMIRRGTRAVRKYLNPEDEKTYYMKDVVLKKSHARKRKYPMKMSLPYL